MSIATRLFCTFIGLMIGNFIYQFFGAGDYGTAGARTFNEAWALLTAYLVLRSGGYK